MLHLSSFFYFLLLLELRSNFYNNVLFAQQDLAKMKNYERGIYFLFALCSQVMQKSCRCGFMYGELTDKETIARIEECLEGQIHDQFEILLYKKNSKSPNLLISCMPRHSMWRPWLFRENRWFRASYVDI